MSYLIYDDHSVYKSIPVTNETVGFKIGRSMDNDVRLREDSSVSRSHCLICLSSDLTTYYLRDLGSSNGTLLNDYTLHSQECELRDGDLIGVGDVNFTFKTGTDAPYELVDTTTIYVNKAVPDISPPNEYSFKETTRMEAVVPTPAPDSDGVGGFPVVDGYEFIRIIGGGNYSTAFLVYHTEVKRSVVLKIFHTGVIEEKKQRMFLDCVSEASLLEHPGILRFLDAGVMDDCCYVTMPYAPQGTLKSLISQFEDGVDESDAVSYILPIVEAMAAVSSSGLYHSDISPSNIMFDESSRTVLSDFGLASWVASVFQPDRTCFFGSTLHMPPEQTLDRGIDWTCDQYALGAVFFEVLTGVPPFNAPSAYALIEKHLREKIRFPGGKKISDKYKLIISQMMAKNPDDRYPSWTAVYNAFRAKKKKGNQSRKNMPLQQKSFAKLKKSPSGIKIQAKSKPVTMKKK